MLITPLAPVFRRRYHRRTWRATGTHANDKVRADIVINHVLYILIPKTGECEDKQELFDTFMLVFTFQEKRSKSLQRPHMTCTGYENVTLNTAQAPPLIRGSRDVGGL